MRTKSSLPLLLMVLSAVGLVSLAVSATDLSIPPPPGLEFREPFVDREGNVLAPNVPPPPDLLVRDPFVDRNGSAVLDTVPPPPGLLVRDPFVDRDGVVTAFQVDPPPDLLFRDFFVNREGVVIRRQVEPPTPDLLKPYLYDFVLRDGSIDPDFVFPTTVADGPSTAVVQEQRVYPNPFNPGAQVQFRLNVGADVRVIIYDLRGRAVRVLQEGFLVPDLYVLRWDGRSEKGTLMPSGVYVFRIQSAGSEVNLKASLLK